MILLLAGVALLGATAQAQAKPTTQPTSQFEQLKAWWANPPDSYRLVTTSTTQVGQNPPVVSVIISERSGNVRLQINGPGVGLDGIQDGLAGSGFNAVEQNDGAVWFLRNSKRMPTPALGQVSWDTGTKPPLDMMEAQSELAVGNFHMAFGLAPGGFDPRSFSWSDRSFSAVMDGFRVDSIAGSVVTSNGVLVQARARTHRNIEVSVTLNYGDGSKVPAWMPVKAVVQRHGVGSTTTIETVSYEEGHVASSEVVRLENRIAPDVLMQVLPSTR